MHSPLDEAIERAAKRKFGLILGCSRLSKLKPGLRSKSAVAAYSLPSRLRFKLTEPPGEEFGIDATHRRLCVEATTHSKAGRNVITKICVVDSSSEL